MLKKQNKKTTTVIAMKILQCNSISRKAHLMFQPTVIMKVIVTKRSGSWNWIN